MYGNKYFDLPNSYWDTFDKVPLSEKITGKIITYKSCPCSYTS